MKRLVYFLLPLFFLVFLNIASCKKKNLLTPVCDGSIPNYDTDIKKIIDTKCMGTFCHNAGANRGDFTSYSNLEPYINNGAFHRTVLVDQTMPKGNKNALTQEEINKFQCWADNNYPEK